MIASAELAAQRLLTDYFISADEIEVVLERASRVPDGAGGWKNVRIPLTEQSFRLIPLGDGAEERTTADGKAVTPSYMLMGRYDVDLARGDQFVVAGTRYQVVFINQNRQYEVKGEVAYLA